MRQDLKKYICDLCGHESHLIPRNTPFRNFYVFFDGGITKHACPVCAKKQVGKLLNLKLLGEQ